MQSYPVYHDIAADPSAKTAAQQFSVESHYFGRLCGITAARITQILQIKPAIPVTFEVILSDR